MEVLGTAVGVASLGIQVCQGLLTYYNTWKSYDADINDTCNSIADISSTLTILEAALKDDTLDEERSDRVEECVKSCRQAIATLSDEALKLRKNVQPAGSKQKIVWAVQRLQYPFQAKTLAKLKAFVGDMQGHLQVALQVLQLESTQQARQTLTALEQSGQEQKRILVFLEQSGQEQERVLVSLEKSTKDQDKFLLSLEHHAQLQRLRDWLAPADPWYNYKLARQVHETGTGDWLLQSSSYLRWKAGAFKHIWLFGKAGCGKTIISSTLIENMLEHCRQMDADFLGIFYFTFADPKLQSYEALLRSLISQLWNNEAGFLVVQQAYNESNGGRLVAKELEEVITALTQSYSNVFIMLDAPDECPEDQNARSDMLRGLEKLAKAIPALKYCVTSRDLPMVRETMNSIAAIPVSIEESVVDADIEVYVNRQLQLDEKLARFNGEVKALILEELSKRANGMFRWAYCQLGKLRTVKLKTKRHIAEVLKNLPSSLDETYERMLLGIDPDYREQAVTLLKWLAYSQRPLTLAELATAAGIRLSGDHKDEVADPEDIDYESPVQILAGLVIETERAHEYGCICRDCKSGLTSIAIVDEFTYLQTSRIKPKSRLALAHFSVKEYLVSPRVLDGPAKYFHLSGSSGDDHLAQSCLAYILYYSTFGEKKSGEEHDTSAFPLLRYAARFWPLHFRRGECSETFRVLSLLDTEAAKSTWLSIDDPDSLREPNDKPPSAIYYATWLGLDALVQSLLENGADADGRGGTHGNALQTACMREDIELARMLLDGGANVNAQGGKLDSALQVACAVGCKEIVCLLLERGADVDVQGGIYGTALQAASLCGHESIVQLLLDEGANVNLQGGKFRQPLQANQHRRIVQMLVDRGADVNMPGIDDSFPLQAATASGYEETVQMLLDKGADINAQSGRYGDALRVAVNQGYEKIVEMLLDRGADINACGGIYGLALQEATNGGRERIAQLLLSRGADVDARDEIHGTALRVASKRGFVEIVQILLDAGADVDARVDLLHETPAATALLEASLQGHDEIVRSLLAGGANVHLRGWYDEAPLHVAAWEGHSTTVRILLDAGAIIAAPTPERPDSLAARTPWYWCSCAEHWDRQKQHEDHGCYEAVETLIIARASDISMLRFTEAQLARAESTGHHELVKILRERCTVTDDASSEDHGTRSADKEGNE